MFGNLPLTVFLILLILSNITSLSIYEATPLLVFNINAGCCDLFLNVSKNDFTNNPTFFLSCPKSPCIQCPTNKKQNCSFILFPIHIFF